MKSKGQKGRPGQAVSVCWLARCKSLLAIKLAIQRNLQTLFKSDCVDARTNCIGLVKRTPSRLRVFFDSEPEQADKDPRFPGPAWRFSHVRPFWSNQVGPKPWNCPTFAYLVDHNRRSAHGFHHKLWCWSAVHILNNFGYLYPAPFSLHLRIASVRAWPVSRRTQLGVPVPGLMKLTKWM